MNEPIEHDGMFKHARALLLSWMVELAGLLVALLAGSLAVVVYALQYGLSGKTVGVAAVGMMAAAASSLLGGCLGFVFGIPRTMQSGGPAPLPPTPTPPEGSGRQQQAAAAAEKGASATGISTRILPAYGANTNLEQISDWLTKILVGVSLTQV